VHTSPKLRQQHPDTHGQIVGKEALRRWWADAMERLPGLRYRPIAVTGDDRRVVMEYERVNPGEPTYRVAEVLVVDVEGRITSSHVFHG
ncbi:nuclear transport factor 2 family protein, partial [Salmonella sp. SAL4359]|uniref:nuclear transport factor 2 family protein n=1 Tax=Salmonella sp. SAL4359 TaxID=3159880 RepID=UPI00397E8759